MYINLVNHSRIFLSSFDNKFRFAIEPNNIFTESLLTYLRICHKNQGLKCFPCRTLDLLSEKFRVQNIYSTLATILMRFSKREFRILRNFYVTNDKKVQLLIHQIFIFKIYYSISNVVHIPEVNLNR